MQIDAVDIYLLEVPLGGQIYNPRMLWNRKQSVLLRLTDHDSGLSGWGECWCFDTSADPLIRFLQTEVRPLLLNQTVTDISSNWTTLWAKTALTGRHGMMASALSAIDIALTDLNARIAGVPLGVLDSNGPQRTDIPVYASAGLYRVNDSIERLKNEMKGLVDEGHNRVKIKFGALPFEQDVARMQAVREAIGPAAGLIIDAVYSLDRSKAENWLPIWQELGVEAVQAPFPIQDWASMRWLNIDCGIPVMAFEAESREEIFRAALQEKAIGMLQFSPVVVGGITASRRLIKLGNEHQLPVTLQCSSTWLAQAVALELARGDEKIAHVELHTLHRGLFDCVDEAERSPSNGILSLHNRTGLGFEPPLDQLLLVNEGLPDLTKGNIQQNQQAPTWD